MAEINLNTIFSDITYSGNRRACVENSDQQIAQAINERMQTSSRQFTTMMERSYRKSALFHFTK